MFLYHVIPLVMMILSDGGYFISGHPYSLVHSPEEANEIQNKIRVMTQPDLNIGPKVDNYDDRSSLENPEELGSYFEGDIILQLNGKNGLVEEVFRWPNGVVPFEIKGTFGESLIYKL